MKSIILTLVLTALFSNMVFSQKDTKENNSEITTKQKELAIPNAFTPNSDGSNDVFKILNFKDEKLIEFSVINRWGTVVFHTTNPNEGWDGTYKGKEQPTGVYGYIIRIAYNEGFMETYKGTVITKLSSCPEG